MRILYVDESGGNEAPSLNNIATPVMAVTGVAFEAGRLSDLTSDFIDFKAAMFPKKFENLISPSAHLSTEIKGSELLHMYRASGRNKRRFAHKFVSNLIELVEKHDGKVAARVWVKDYENVLEQGNYNYAFQNIARIFSSHLKVNKDVGIVIADSRDHRGNSSVSKSILDRGLRNSSFSSLVDVPVYGTSNNHAGIQIADLVSTCLVFPIAISAYCNRELITGVHSPDKYDEVRTMFVDDLERMQMTAYGRQGKILNGILASGVDRIKLPPMSQISSTDFDTAA